MSEEATQPLGGIEGRAQAEALVAALAGPGRGLDAVAPPFAEGLLRRVAHAFARATGHAARRPPACGA
jgi:hypothetical protein